VNSADTIVCGDSSFSTHIRDITLGIMSTTIDLDFEELEFRPQDELTSKSCEKDSEVELRPLTSSAISERLKKPKSGKFKPKLPMIEESTETEISPAVFV
jgi:hypothetical protein